MMKSAIGTKFNSKFGQSTVVGYEAPYRIESYVSFVCEEMYVDRVIALGADDDSVAIEMSGPNAERDMRCSYCANCTAHTKRVHQANLFTMQWRAA